MYEIKVIEYETEKIIKIIDCGEKTLRAVEKIDNGLNINLSDEFYTRIYDREAT